MSPALARAAAPEGREPSWRSDGHGSVSAPMDMGRSALRWTRTVSAPMDTDGRAHDWGAEGDGGGRAVQVAVAEGEGAAIRRQQPVATARGCRSSTHFRGSSVEPVSDPMHAASP